MLNYASILHNIQHFSYLQIVAVELKFPNRSRTIYILLTSDAKQLLLHARSLYSPLGLGCWCALQVMNGVSLIRARAR